MRERKPYQKEKCRVRNLLKLNDMKKNQEITKEFAMEKAKRFGLEQEVAFAIKTGCSPKEALQEWDLWDYDED